jgi:DNA-directed RNA polymerase subunit RPC12/RpoP
VERRRGMRRLIDADRLRKDILNLQDCYNGFSDTYDKACIIGVIDEQPTAEKVGKWIIHSEVKNIYGGTYIECSECGEKYVVQYIEAEKFCRNCGARMEGEEG